MRAKKIFSIIFLFTILILFSCQQEKKNTNKESGAYFTGKPKIKFSNIDRNFGTIEEGEEIMLSFKFQNTGDSPLMIYKVKPSCGCTVSKFPHDPINPGDSAQITLIFNSSGYSGYQIKTAKVFTNTRDSIITLTIEGEVNANH